MHNAEKSPDLLQVSYGVHNARFLRHVSTLCTKDGEKYDHK